MLHAAYLTIGKLAPDYENVELSVGGSTVAAAVVEATGQSPLSRLNLPWSVLAAELNSMFGLQS